ncbi:hypothetical protein MD484_g4648, partial [Candolleomyces efflorescens]
MRFSNLISALALTFLTVTSASPIPSEQIRDVVARDAEAGPPTGSPSWRDTHVMINRAEEGSPAWKEIPQDSGSPAWREAVHSREEEGPPVPPWRREPEEDEAAPAGAPPWRRDAVAAPPWRTVAGAPEGSEPPPPWR